MIGYTTKQPGQDWGKPTIPSFINTDKSAKTSYLNVRLRGEDHTGILTLSDHNLIYYPGSTEGKKKRLSWTAIQSVDNNSSSSAKAKLRIKYKEHKKPMLLELADRSEMHLIQLDIARRIAQSNRASPDTLLALPAEQPALSIPNYSNSSHRSEREMPEYRGLAVQLPPVDGGYEECMEMGEIGNAPGSFTSHTAPDESWLDHIHHGELQGVSPERNEGTFYQDLRTAIAAKQSDPDWMRSLGWLLIALVLFLFVVTVLVVTFTYKGGVV